jgi:hypothetical protein
MEAEVAAARRALATVPSATRKALDRDEVYIHRVWDKPKRYTLVDHGRDIGAAKYLDELFCDTNAEERYGEGTLIEVWDEDENRWTGTVDVSSP